MFYSIDDRTHKHSVNSMRANAQRTTANIPIGRIGKLFLSVVVPLLLSATEG